MPATLNNVTAAGNVSMLSRSMTRTGHIAGGPRKVASAVMHRSKQASPSTPARGRDVCYRVESLLRQSGLTPSLGKGRIDLRSQPNRYRKSLYREVGLQLQHLPRGRPCLLHMVEPRQRRCQQSMGNAETRIGLDRAARGVSRLLVPFGVEVCDR